MQLYSEAKFSLELAVRKQLRAGVLTEEGVAVVALGLCTGTFLEAELVLSIFVSLS